MNVLCWVRMKGLLYRLASFAAAREERYGCPCAWISLLFLVSSRKGLKLVMFGMGYGYSEPESYV